MFHKATNLVFLDNCVILVGFKDNEWRTFDMKSMMKKHPIVEALKNEELFKSGKIEVGGFGIVWNDDIDISASSVYESGNKVDPSDYNVGNDKLRVELKKLREDNGLSQNDLAHLSGVTQSTIARIEKGQIDPTITTFEKLLAPFGLSLSIK